MVPGNAHVDAKKQGKAFLYGPRQIRRRYQKTGHPNGCPVFCPLSGGCIRTLEGVNEASVEPQSHALPERVEREISNPIAAIFASDRI